MPVSRLVRLVAAVAAVLLLAPACGRGNAPAPVGIHRHGKMIFDDEFTGSTLGGAWCPGWFGRGTSGPVNSSEIGPYLSSNVTVHDGVLNLTEDGHYGALVSTNPSDRCHGQHPGFQFTYGIIEFRAWLPPAPQGVANWPALWTDGQHWPQNGEIDVLEAFDGMAWAHYHYGHGESDWHPDNGVMVPGSWAGGWHTFAADWRPGRITFYYDGRKVWHTSTGVVNDPMYAIIDYTVNSGDPVTRATMKIDYVRVWQSR